MADIVLTVDVDSKSASQGMAKFQRETLKEVGKVSKGMKAMGEAGKKAAKAAAADTKDWKEEVGDLAKYYQDEVSRIHSLEGALKRVKKAQDDAKDSGDKGAKKAAKAQAKAIKGELAAQAKSLKTKALPGFDTKKLAEESKSALADAGSELKGTLSAFFSKDLKGVILGAGGLGGALVKSLTKGLAGGSAKLTGMGTDMGRKGKEKGGMGGAGMKALGSSMKSLGSLGAKLGPMLGTLAKLGPILGMVGAGIAGLVKLFIDADAQAKQFQKSVLQSASTTEYLAAAGGNAALAYDDLATDMAKIRDAAFSLQNAKWGISSEQHVAVLNTLNQEGIALHDMRERAKAAGQEIGEFTAQLTHVSVAYSRHFGVPLQEIGQLQSELMREMGMSLDSTQLAFSQMTRSASESGIAANKFFSIIRGVSQDLSNYNVRMGSAIKLLKMLGKVMNPRNAQKFMQSATQGLKQMSQDDRLKVALLTGGKGKKIVAKDLANKRKNLHNDIAKAIGAEADDVAKRLSDPKQAKALWDEVRKKASSSAGALREQELELKIDTEANKKGVYGQAFAMENMGAGGSLDMMTAALSTFSGSKTLMGGAGDLGMTKMAEMLGINTQQLRGMMKLEVAVKEEKEALLDQGKKDLAAATTEDQKAAAREKIRLGTEGTTQDILDTMSAEQKGALEDQTKTEIDFAREQGNMTQSLLEKFQVLIDFLMNQLYNVLLGIWDAIPGSDSRKVAAARTKNPELMALAEKADSSKEFTEGVGKSAVFKDLLSTIRSGTGTSVKEKEDRIKTLKEEVGAKIRGKDVHSPEDKEKKIAEIARLEEETKKQKAARGAVDVMGAGPTMDNLLGGGFNMGIKEIMEAASVGDIDAKVEKMVEAREGGATFSEGMDQAGFTEFERARMVEQMALGTGGGVGTDALMTGVAQYGTESTAAIRPTPEEEEKAKKAAEEAAKTSGNTRDAAKAAKDTADTLQNKHTAYVAFSPNFLKGGFKDTVKEAVLDAIRQGLFEYYMYSGLDRESVAKTLSSENITLNEFLDDVTETTLKGRLIEDKYDTLEAGADDDEKGKDGKGEPKKPKKKAQGGLVSHIGPDGLAIFRTPPGEGVTGIGPGERIIPAYAGGGGGGGGGGGTTHVTIGIAPGAQKLIQTEVQHGIVEHERRKRTAG
jgi:hypothetical protein